MDLRYLFITWNPGFFGIAGAMQEKSLTYAFWLSNYIHMNYLPCARAQTNWEILSSKWLDRISIKNINTKRKHDRTKS